MAALSADMLGGALLLRPPKQEKRNRNGEPSKAKNFRGSPFLKSIAVKIYFFFLAAALFAAGFLAAGFFVVRLLLVLVFFFAGFFAAFLVAFLAGAIASSRLWIWAAPSVHEPRIRRPVGYVTLYYNLQCLEMQCFLHICRILYFPGRPI
jgi:hypothetical protein